MKLRYICLLGLITLIGADDLPANVRVVKTVSSSISSEPPAPFETAHKITENREFETAHKITNERPIIKLLDDDQNDAATDLDLMQQQNPQNLLSTKERPELNPVLSALINEDVMKSIESKRAIEESVTVAPMNTLTTSEQPLKVTDDDVVANVGLVDQSVNLDEAGSEMNQKSRIQIKKGPNGQDYEYEYVYYYYDEDEKNEKGGQAKQQKGAASELASASRESSTRGKSRYTNIERSTTSAPDNEIGGGRGRGRANAAAAPDVEEGRLPQNTRFPPRSRGADVTPAPEAGDEKTAGRRIGVKRPSLDLVDSDSFNTDEKQVKSNRNIENELNKKSADDEDSEGVRAEEEADPDSVPQTTNAVDLDVENTTPLMEKAALDLYAIIANENFNMDATTGDSVDATTTDVPTTSADELTTIMEEEPTTTTTTTTTTTPEPTTTTTTTTTTTPAPGRRGGIGSGSRNRFRLKNGSATTTTEGPAESGKTGGKNKARFGGRPSFGSGRTTRPSKENNNKEEVKEEVNKEETKPSSLRGRTRNRFNLRGASTTEKSTDENTIDSKPVSTTARSRPARPQLNLRGRGRPAATSTPAPTSDVDNEASPAAADGGDKPTQSTASLPRPSRFNLGRPGAAAGGGGGRLLPRGRINPLKPAVAAKESAPNDEKPEDEAAAAPAAANEDAPSTDGEKATQEPAPAPTGGLNRLKSRPKIQVTQKTAKAPGPVIVRKPNPLIGRKRIVASSTTTEAPASDDETADEGAGDDENVAGDENDPKDEAASDAAPQIVEIASEQPARGLGLLANRRRLAIRKPGTLN